MIESIRIGSLSVRVKTEGEGEALLLLHGWGGSIESVAPLMADLSPYCRVIAFDFPGFGKSDAPKKGWGVKEYATLTRAVMRHYGVRRAHIVGHSFGGRVALYLGACFGGTVNRMVLLAGAGVKPRRNIRYYYRKYRYRVAKFLHRHGLCNKFDAQQYGSEEYRSLSGVMRHTFSLVVEEDLSPLLGRVFAPTLLIYGDKDRETPVYMAKKMARLMPKATLQIQKKCGHFAYLEKRMQISYACIRFLFYPKEKENE